MAEPLDTEIGHYFEWNTKLPPDWCVSPMFIFRDFRFRFRISKFGNAHFRTFLDQPTGEAYCWPFMVETYKEYNSCALLIIHWLRVESTLQKCSTGIHKYEGQTGVSVKFIFHLECGVEQTSGSFKESIQPILSCSNFCDNPCLDSLSQDFSKLLDAESGQDIALKCGRSIVKAHKIVLVNRSDAFKSMLDDDIIVNPPARQLNIFDIHEEIFPEFIRYLYTGDLPDLSVSTAKKLYKAGHEYCVESIKRRCATFLSESLTTETACEYLRMADDHGDNEFKERVISYILAMKATLTGDCWMAFFARSPAVAVDILNRCIKLQNIA